MKTKEVDTMTFEKQLGKMVASGKLTIPPYPAAAMRLAAMVKADDYTVGGLAGVLGADQTLAATVLRYANAATNGRTLVSNLEQAVMRLGSKELTQIAYASSLAGKVCQDGVLLELRRLVWRHAILCAEFCREIARRRNQDHNTAFLCGLLHDFGRVVSIACIERLMRQKPARLSRERCLALIERHHITLGLTIAKKWDLPPVLHRVIAKHHTTDGADAKDPMVRLVRAADAVVALMDREPSVSAEQLMAIEDLDAVDARFVARLLPQLPAKVQALEAPPSNARLPVRAILERSTSALGSEIYPTNFSAHRIKCKESRKLDIVGIGANGFAAVSAVPLPEQHVACFQLDCTPAPFEVWGNVVACRPQDHSYYVEVRLFAIDGTVKKQWAALYWQAKATESNAAATG